MKGIVDKEGEPLPCNCNAQTKSEDGKCIYNGLCRVQMTIYDLKCKITGKSYIGKTQRNLKTRTSEHFADVFKVLEAKRGDRTYKQVDAFAKHFAELCKDCTTSNEVKAKLKKIVDVSIIWTGDRLRCMKSARTLDCRICMAEREEILARMRANPDKVINDRSEIFGSCNCRTNFYKLSRLDPTLRTHLMQKKSPHSLKSTKTRPTRPPSSVIVNSCECCHTQPHPTKIKRNFKSRPMPICCQSCDQPKQTTLEKIHPTNSKQIGGFSFNTKVPVIHPIQLTWKKHQITGIEVPYPSQWQYLEDNPRQLVNVGHPKIQLGLIDTNIPCLKTRELTRQPSNLEIDQIVQASSHYPKVAETLALVNLVIPEAVGKGLGRFKAMMDRLNS